MVVVDELKLFFHSYNISNDADSKSLLIENIQRELLDTRRGPFPSDGLCPAFIDPPTNTLYRNNTSPICIQIPSFSLDL